MTPEYNNEICSMCKKECVALVRQEQYEDSILETQNIAFICVNPNCSMKIDVNKVKNWVEVNKGRLN